MRIGLYLLCLLIFGLMFEIAQPIEDAFFPERQSFFLLSDHQMYFSSFIYYIQEHLINIFLILIIYFEINYGRFLVGVYAWLEFLDGLDFWVSANGDWFYIKGYPITFNIIKVFVFTLAIGYEYYRSTVAGKA